MPLDDSRLMKIRRISRIALLFLPLVGFILIETSPYYAARFSLLLHGIPFAQVNKRDALKYVPTDSFRNAGIVISEGRAVGWIYAPMMGFSRFVPFAEIHSLDGPEKPDPVMDCPILFLLWERRWLLLVAQGVLLIVWGVVFWRKHRRTAPR